MVAQGIRPTIFWSNSNIYDKAEYDKRLGEITRYADSLGVPVTVDEYNHSDWLSYVKEQLPDAPGSYPERSDRCQACFRYRLSRAALFAGSNGFTCLTSSLASSRWKSLEQVDAAGRNAVATALRSNATSRRPGYIRGGAPDNATEGSPARQTLVWWGQNWRICGLQPRRSEIIREQNFYNQDFCGCEFSIRNK